ncbi:MAG: LLM class flavin-dependent oxidoreductase, partial [Actinobacteria bacterium]
KHYRLQGAICQPKPAQDPHIPLWIAGGGEQLTLRTAARHAAYSNFGQTIENFNRKSEVLAGHCRNVGRDFDEIVRSANFNVLIGADEAEVRDRLDWYRSHLRPFLSEERIERTIQANYIDAGGVVGTPEQVVEYFTQWQEAGADYAICYFADAAYDRRGLDLFAGQVIPALA